MLDYLLLARGTAQYYALEQLFHQTPPDHSPEVERVHSAPKRRIRKALAKLPQRVAAFFGQHGKAQGCG